MSIRVLIADPNKNFLDSYANYLSLRDFIVDTATNGLECLEKLHEFMPDILVMDPILPWGGGDGVLAVMQEQDDMQFIPVMILTYGDDPAMMYNISRFPIFDFQKKPMPARLLADRIFSIIFGQPVVSESAGISTQLLEAM